MAERRSIVDWFIEALALLALLFVCLMIILHWNRPPDRIVTHFGPSGNPDRWGSKSVLSALPFSALGIYALLTILPFYPRLYNLPSGVDRIQRSL